MKILGYVIFALSIATSVSVFAANDKDIAKSNESNTTTETTELRPHSLSNRNKAPLTDASSSRNVMLDAMENPLIRETFHKAQLRILQTPADALVHNYYTNDPVGSALYKEFQSLSEKMLNDYSLNAQSNMLQLVRGLTPQYDSFDKLFVDIGIDSGIKEEIISNRELYLMPGSVNAATVSGTQNKMIALATDTLIESMSRKELAAVLAHEVGHIRAEHPVKGMMNNFMLSIIAELYMTGKVEINQAVSFKLDEVSKRSGIHSTTCQGVCGHAQNLGGFSLMASAKSSFSSGVIKVLVENLEKMPKHMFHKSIASYLNVLVQVGIQEKASPATIEYFRTLEMMSSRIGTFRVMPEEFMAHAQEITLAYSRAKEKTADNISASLTRNLNLASANAKLLGSKFDNADKESQEKIFEQIKRQAQRVQDVAAKDSSMYRFVGSSHPSLAHRTLRILEIPTYPSVIFANGFLKLLFIQESLAELEATNKQILAGYAGSKDAVDTFIAKELAQYKAAGATEEDLKEIRKKYEEQMHLSKQSDIKAFAEASSARFVHETSVMNLIFDKKFPITAKRSPRFENAVQYFAIQNEVRFMVAASLVKAIEAAKAKTINPNQAGEVRNLELRLASVEKFIERQAKFINKIKDRLLEESEKTQDPQAKEYLKQRYTLLLRLLQAKDSAQLEDIRRAVMTISLKTVVRDIRNKIPVRINEGAVVTSPFAKGQPSAGGGLCAPLFK